MTGRAWALLGLVLFAGSGLAGCNRTLDQSPHLLAPKLLLSRTGDPGEVELYVHSAVGEHQYDTLLLKVDNATVVASNTTYGIIHRIPLARSYLTLEATSGDNRYALEALLIPAAAGQPPTIATYHGGREVERRAVDLPWDKLLEKVETA